MITPHPHTLWTPTLDDIAQAGITRFRTWLSTERDIEHQDDDALWRWSVDELENFWGAIWDYFQITSHAPFTEVLDRRAMPGARWFEGATLNYAEHILRNATPDRPAIVAVTEDAPDVEITWQQLTRDTAALTHTLREAGIGPGDRVCAYMSNIPETIVAFLAVASIGAVWSVSAPDYGIDGVLSRFEQLEPKALISVDAYRWNGKQISRAAEIAALQARLPSLGLTVVVPRGGETLASSTWDTVAWSDALAIDQPLRIDPVPFGHPLWVLFSSGSTGLPKGIVHSHGGITLEQLKAARLGHDVRPDDRWFMFSPTSWAAWNSTIGRLLLGATVVAYDGSPTHPDLLGSWRIVAGQGVSVFGAGAAYLDANAKLGADLSELDLSALRLICITGSGLAPRTWEWLYDQIDSRVRVESAYGATDVCSAMHGGSPCKPVIANELNGRCLGVRLEVWNADGRPVVDEVGELVITEPMPSMPTHLHNDPDGIRLHESYFDVYPRTWRIGDWGRTTPDGSIVIEGRSDATLNRGGVRMGSTDFYAVVEPLGGVLDSLVVGVDLPDGAYYMPLFVVLAEGRALEDGLRGQIVSEIRQRLSPRHVPDEIVVVPTVPRTKTGKKLEVPIKRILSGTPIEQTVSLGAVDNPDAVNWFARFAASRAC